MSVKEYQEKVNTAVTAGFQSLLLAAGFKLKLFKYIGGENDPRTSQEIAKLGNYKERYVREWLSAMVVGGFIECDPSGTRFWMTSNAIEAMKSEEVQGLLTVSTFLPFLSFVFGQICECFKMDGPSGIPYSACGPVHEEIALLTGGAWKKHLISNFIPAIPGLQAELERGSTCVDVGCGTGTVVLLLAERFPNSQFYGVDLCDDAVAMATKAAREKSLSNAQFVTADARQLPADWTSKFDYATAFDSVHDLARPDLCLLEIQRVLKPDGRLSVVDIDAQSNVYDNKSDPKANFCYTASLFHCMAVSLYFPDGFGLGTMCGVQKITAILRDAGFAEVKICDLVFDDSKFNVHYLCTKGKPSLANL